MDLIEQVKLFPQEPGVYIMRDSFGTVIYVGKAKKLKNRVLQYFRQTKDRAPKIENLVSSIHSIEYILTDTELEAFLTECRLIKEIKPKFNSQMKNDGRYLYIKISINEKYPKLSIVKGRDAAEGLYYGPYTSQGSVERTVLFIKENFLVRKCSSLPIKRKSSGCINYSMGLCMGVCREDADHNAYSQCINNIVLFLEGKQNSMVDSLKERIRIAAERLEFEKAAKYRDDLMAVKHVLNKQSLIRSSLRSRNIIAIEAIGSSIFKVFLFKGNKLKQLETFNAGGIDKKSAGEYFHAFITSGLKNINQEVYETISRQDIDEAQIIYSYLKHKKNNIKSFWIPSCWMDKGNERLITGIDKIVYRIYQDME